MRHSPPPQQPPRWLDKLVESLCAPHLREEVLGDLHERYYRRVQQVGEAKARRRYWREVLAYLRPSIIKRQPSQSLKPIPMDMLSSTLLVREEPKGNRVSILK